MVTFSICVPNYNYGAYIERTLRSVLAQTYPHYEIIVVDNASTDESVAVVESLASDRIRLFKNPFNVGFAPNLDRAASHAVNDFIIMLSSDDLMKPAALEEYARAIEALGDDAHEALIGSGIDHIDAAGNVLLTQGLSDYIPLEQDPSLSRRAGNRDIAVFDGLQVFREVFPRNATPTPFLATAYSRRLYERLGGYSSLHPMGPDTDFVYKALLHGARVAFLDCSLFQYRVHGTNQTQQDRGRQSLKAQLDRYMFTMQFTDEQLRRAGASRDDAAHGLVDRACLNQGLLEIKNGNNAYSFRLLAFAFATYPAEAVRNPKSYLLALLLAGGPAGSWLARVLWRTRVRTMQPSAGKSVS